MEVENGIVIYTRVITRLFSNAHQPYTTTRDYKKTARNINEILHRLIKDYGLDYTMTVIQRVARATNKPFGPLDREIAMEITRRGGKLPLGPDDTWCCARETTTSEPDSDR